MSDWTSKEALEKWWASPSQSHFKRPYTAEDVLALRDVFQESESGNHFAQILRRIMDKHVSAKTHTLAMSTIDPVSLQMMAEIGLESAYVSGALCSMTETPTVDPSTDLADYTYDTVPKKVATLVRSQLLHARTAQASKRPATPLVPIIADADSGHGLTSSTMKLVKLFVQSGAAGIHIDDLLSGAKRFDGKDQVGNILVPTNELIRRLTAAKLQLDIMGSEMVLLQRTDAETATHITSTIDPRDRRFILGATVRTARDLCSMESSAAKSEWLAGADVQTLDDAFQRSYPDSVPAFAAKTAGMNVSEALRVAQELAPDFYWSAEACRTVQGWYRFRGGIEAAIERSLCGAPFTDVSWSCAMSYSPKNAEAFARAIQDAYPGRYMAFNITGAFALPADGSQDDSIRGLSQYLGGLGYCWQFLPLSGLTAVGLGSRIAASSVKSNDVLGYIQTVSRPAERAMPSSSVEWWWKSMGKLTDIAGEAIGTGL